MRPHFTVLNRFRFFFKFLSYLFTAKDEHSIHSPFVFQLYTEVIKPVKRFYVFKKIEWWRHYLSENDDLIDITDLGAGSKINKSTRRKVKNIARHSEKPKKVGQLLFKLINKFKPGEIFDLGTSLGLTTMYIASASNNSKVTTFEGCPNTLNKAKEYFGKIGLTNISAVEGNIDVTLPEKIKEVSSLDFVFFDANHRYEPTMRYFEICLSKATEESIFVFDDIYWSEEMEKAWNDIKSHPEVIVTIDLFFVGLVFFRTKQPKQHFTLRF